jgi:dihydrofolate reductase
MRPVVVYAATSLDGFIAGPDDDLSWLPPAGAETDYEEFLGAVGAVVMGRRTWEILPSLGPYPYAELPAYVMSRTLEPGRRGPVVVTAASPQELAAELRDGDGVAWLVGGGGVFGAFAAAGLVDEWIITVVPALLGQGVPLLAPGTPRQTLALTGRRDFPGGLVQLRYRTPA